MKVLVDTNILGRFSQPDHPDHGVVVAVLKSLGSGSDLHLIPQVLYEYWTVATRPGEVNGLGFSCEETAVRVTDFIRLFPLLRDERRVFDIWQKLVVDKDVKGKLSHDARVVAAMEKHGISHILTFNGKDFKRYARIEVIDPHEI